LDKDSKRRVTDNAALDRASHLMRVEELFPCVRLKLLDAKRQPMVFRIDIQNDRIDLLAFLQDFGRVFDAPGGNIGNVHQAVDSLFDFDEGSKIRQIANPAGNYGIDSVA